MSTLPVLLKEPCILVLGGGSVALQKATVLVSNDIKFSIISFEYCSEFEDLYVDKITKKIELSDFDHCNIIVDATGSDDVGHLLNEVRKTRFLLVNRVDSPEQCNFFFSALLRYGSLKVAVSTDGASPTIGKIVRDKINAILPKGLASLVAKTNHQRQHGHIEPMQTRDQMMTLFSDVLLIECDTIVDTLLTLKKHPQLCTFDVIVCQQQYLQSPLTIESPQHSIRFIPMMGQDGVFDAVELYTFLKSYCQDGVKIGVLIQSHDQFSDHAEKLCTRLRNDGVKVEISR